MGHAVLITEFAAARRAMMNDLGVCGRPVPTYIAERRAVAERYNAAADAIERAADEIAAAAPPQ